MGALALLVDDDRSFSSLSAAALRREGFRVAVAHSLRDARRALGESTPDVVVLDRRLPDGDGLDAVAEFRRLAPGAAVLVVTAAADIAGAVAAIHAGASDYVVKPVELPDLLAKVRKAAEHLLLRERVDRLEHEQQDRLRLIEPHAPAMQQLLEALARVAAMGRAPVLLLGETGVGKEVLARFLHQRGPTPLGPFVHLNCANLDAHTAESELFGHERGAFTDARSAKRGLVEAAEGGTLFLDEVGDLPLAVQAKLLTFLDTGEFRRLGATAPGQSRARIVAATHRDLPGEVRRGAFREDLWFRLATFRFPVPPLRERPEDIVPLAEGLVARLSTELGRRGATLSEAARTRLRAYPFPGNVRELRSVLERALVLESGPELALLDLARPGEAPLEAGSFVVAGPTVTLDELARRYVRHVLEQHGGRRTEAARSLGVSYPTFLKRLGEAPEGE